MVQTSLFILAQDFPQAPDLAIPNGPYDESVALAKRFGYDGIELIPGDPDLVDADALEAALKKHGMAISAINSGGINYVLKISLVNADPEKEKIAFQKLQTLIRLSKRFGCLQQVGVARGFAIHGVSNEQFKTRLVAVLQKACDYAAEQGVQIIFEYTNRIEINTILNLNEALEIIGRVDRPNISLLLDTGHSWLEDPDVYESLRRAKGYLRHVHLHDSDQGPPGASKNGVLDFDRIIRIFKEIGFSGFVSDGLMTSALPETQVLQSSSYLKSKFAEHGLR